MFVTRIIWITQFSSDVATCLLSFHISYHHLLSLSSGDQQAFMNFSIALVVIPWGSCVFMSKGHRVVFWFSSCFHQVRLCSPFVFRRYAHKICWAFKEARLLDGTSLRINLFYWSPAGSSSTPEWLHQFVDQALHQALPGSATIWSVFYELFSWISRVLMRFPGVILNSLHQTLQIFISFQKFFMSCHQALNAFSSVRQVAHHIIDQGPECVIKFSFNWSSGFSAGAKAFIRSS